MPDDLKKAIIEAIAASGDENYKRLLLLLLRVEEMFLEKVDSLADQLTVPVQQHAEDHQWIASTRETEGGVKDAALKVAFSVVEKGGLVGAGWIVSRLFGG